MYRSIVVLLVCVGLPGFGADLYVNNKAGRDEAAGTSREAAFRTINRAIAMAKPGDTIQLTPTGRLYRQTAHFSGKGGLPGKPITLDGRGVTLTGADPCRPDGWKPWRAGVLMREDMISHGFLLVDEEMVFMRLARDALEPLELCWEFNTLYMHIPKGANPEVEVGQPDGKAVRIPPEKWHPSHSRLGRVRRFRGIKEPAWVKVNGKTVELVQRRDRLQPGMWTVQEKTLYYLPPEGKPIAQLDISCITRGNGVQMDGRFSHVIVRNLNVQHVANDGYNIHGAVTEVEFYNCNARDCFDEGFSAHDKCGTLLDGAVYVNCDNGIANVNTDGYSITRNVILADARHVGFLIISRGTARHELRNAILIDSPTQLSAADLKADNLFVIETPQAPGGYGSALNCGRNVQLSRVTAVGNPALFRAGATSNVDMTNSVLAGGQGPLHIRADEPMKLLKFTNVVFGPDLVVEWGARYPWKRRPISDWLKDAEAAGTAVQCRVDDTRTLRALLENRLPADVPAAGCTEELLRRYVAYRRGKQ